MEASKIHQQGGCLFIAEVSVQHLDFIGQLAKVTNV